MKIIYSTQQARSPYTKHAASGLPNPTPLIYPGSRPAGFSTRRPRMVTDCLLNRSMLIKIYYLFMVCARIYIYGQLISYSCLHVLGLFSLSNCINVFVWHNNYIRKHEYAFVTTITIDFGGSPQSKLSSSELLMLLYTSIGHLFAFACPRQTMHLRFEISFRPRITLIGRLPHLAMISSPREVFIWMNIWESLPADCLFTVFFFCFFFLLLLLVFFFFFFCFVCFIFWCWFFFLFCFFALFSLSLVHACAVFLQSWYYHLYLNNLIKIGSNLITPLRAQRNLRSDFYDLILICLFVLRFYGPVNNYGHVEPVSYRLTLFLGRLGPTKRLTST